MDLEQERSLEGYIIYYYRMSLLQRRKSNSHNMFDYNWLIGIDHILKRSISTKLKEYEEMSDYDHDPPYSDSHIRCGDVLGRIRGMSNL